MQAIEQQLQFYNKETTLTKLFRDLLTRWDQRRL